MPDALSALKGAIPFTLQLHLTTEGPGYQSTTVFNLGRIPSAISNIEPGQFFLFASLTDPAPIAVATILVPWRKLDDTTVENPFSGDMQIIADPHQLVYPASQGAE